MDESSLILFVEARVERGLGWSNFAPSSLMCAEWYKDIHGDYYDKKREEKTHSGLRKSARVQSTTLKGVLTST